MPNLFKPEYKSLSEIMYFLLKDRYKLTFQIRNAANPNQILKMVQATFKLVNGNMVPTIVEPVQGLSVEQLIRDEEEVGVLFTWEMLIDGKKYTCPAIIKWNPDKPYIVNKDNKLTINPV